MNLAFRLLLAAALTASAPVWAQQAATVTTGVSMRAGPDRGMPSVTTLLSRTSVELVGCLSNWSWCDVIAGRSRGWVYSRYLSVRADDTAITVVRGGPNLGLPVVEFALGPYWDEHYQGRIWYPQKAAQQLRWDQRREQRPWRDPASASATAPERR